MNTLIFEGIATSGKSTVIKHLKSSLKDKMFIFQASETETHEPIINNTSELHILFYLDLINELTLKHPELLIFDRLYLTQAFRARVSLENYREVENALKPYNPTTIFLKVQPSSIPERIKHAISHRDAEWGDYVATKGPNFQKQAEYYIEQQDALLKLLKQSTLPFKIIETTDHNYGDVTENILDLIDK